MPDIRKAYAINDAKIVFVSLVDKAANKREFLITKAENGQASFQSYGRILKADDNTHWVTGIVYEPNTEDTQGNYMTAGEIEKACYWFAKNGIGNDLQHNFEPLEGASVVESWIAKADFEINGETVQKGTWLMTVELTNPEIYEAVRKGEITGFSMGGTGVYDDTDVDLGNDVPDTNVVKTTEGKGIMKRIAALFGMDIVEKGEVRNRYAARSVRDNFWNAYNALSGYLLDHYNPQTDRWEPQTDEEVIRNALQDFNEIITELLTGTEPIVKRLTADPVEKAGKALSTANHTALKNIHASLTEFLQKFEEEEEIEVTKAELEGIVADAISKSMAQNTQNAPQTASTPEGELTPTGAVEKGAAAPTEAEQGITKADIEKMVAEAVQKATTPKEEPLTKEQIQSCIEETVAKALEPVLKATGVPSNLNGQEGIEKSEGTEQHYLHGIL